MAEVSLPRGAKILIVDDNQTNQLVVEALLDENDMFAKIAWNGKEALEMLEQESFDGVIMDCQMPVMDGYEATRQLRKRDEWKNLPVLAMTASAMVGDREKALACGMNDYITKPIDCDVVLAKIAKWITAAHPDDCDREARGGSNNQQKSAASELPEQPDAEDKNADESQRGSSYFKQQLVHLQQLLAENDTDALDAATELLRFTTDDEQQDIIGNLIAALDDYNFDLAQSELNRLKSIPE
jgi:CheY-like chemotaxis protein